MSTVPACAVKITLPEMQQVILHYAVRMGLPCMFYGPPGCGKTVGAWQIANAHDYIMLDFRLNQYTNVDFRGFPGLMSAGDIAKLSGGTIYDKKKSGNMMAAWNIASTLPFEHNPLFPDDKTILVFFDEMNGGTDQLVFAVFMQLVNEGGIGEHKLKKNVRIIAAGNRAGDRSVAVNTPKALDNRFLNFEIGYDAKVFSNHLPKIVKPETAARAMAFFGVKPELVSTFDPTSTMKSFATYRTWEKALNIFEDTQVSVTMKKIGMAAAIGSGPTDAFFAFLDVWRLIAGYIGDIKKDAARAPIPDALDQRYALSMAVSGELTKRNIASIWPYVERLGEISQEFPVLIMHAATERDPALYETPQFMRYSQSLQRSLEEV